MPKSSWAPPKAMRGKCERGHGSVNADGGSVNAGAEVQTQTGRVRKPSRAMGTRRGRLSAPWPRFHGVDRADVYIIIHVRACCCGECALNPQPSQHIPRRRPSLAPAQRHALAEHFRSPTQPRRTPPHSDARPQAARCIPHRPHNPFPAEALRPPHTATRPSRALPLPHAMPTPARRLRDARPQTARCIPRRRLPLAPAQRHALAEHFRSPPQCQCTPAAQTHIRRPHNPFPAEDLRPPPHSDTPFPCPPATSPQRRRTPAGCAMHSSPPSPPIPRSAALPPPPFRFGHKKNGTAQCMCDAECLGRPSLRSVIGVGEPRAVRRRCGALACRRGA